MANPYHPLHEILPDKSWQGDPCFLVGGGPSLRNFDFERLRNQGRVIAINRAYEFMPWADMLFFMDFTFWQYEHQDPVRLEKWNSFKGPKVFLNLMGRKFEDCYSVKALSRSGISISHTAGLYHGNNSGFGALQLALSLGCRPIYLLGFDMTKQGNKSGTGEKTHWHDGYGKITSLATPLNFRRDFELVAMRLRDFPFIYNLNPASGLKVFPFKSVEEVIDAK